MYLCIEAGHFLFEILQVIVTVLDSGVCHADELPMLFVMPGIFEISKNDQDPDYIFSKQVVKLWADFAKNE